MDGRHCILSRLDPWDRPLFVADEVKGMRLAGRNCQVIYRPPRSVVIHWHPRPTPTDRFDWASEGWRDPSDPASDLRTEPHSDDQSGRVARGAPVDHRRGVGLVRDGAVLGASAWPWLLLAAIPPVLAFFYLQSR